MRQTCRDGLVEEEISEDGVDRFSIRGVGDVLAEGGMRLGDDEVVAKERRETRKRGKPGKRDGD